MIFSCSQHPYYHLKWKTTLHARQVRRTTAAFRPVLEPGMRPSNVKRHELSAAVIRRHVAALDGFFIERRPRQPDTRRRSRVAFSLWSATLPNCVNYAPNQRLSLLFSAVTVAKSPEGGVRRCPTDA